MVSGITDFFTRPRCMYEYRAQKRFQISTLFDFTRFEIADNCLEFFSNRSTDYLTVKIHGH